MNRRNSIFAGVLSLLSARQAMAVNDSVSINKSNVMPKSNKPEGVIDSGSDDSSSHTFLLVHGAWHGAWCWKYLQHQLSEMGHASHALTLTGLAETAHLLTKEVGLDTHIQDVLDYVQDKQLDNFVLVGHSYGGMVISGAAEKISSKIKGLVYLDAIVPQDNDSLFSSGMPDNLEMIAQIEQSVRGMSQDGLTIPPPPAVGLGIPESDTENLAWVNQLLTPHPLKTWLDTVSIQNPEAQKLSKAFVHCTNPQLESNIGAIAQRLKNDEQWTFIEMDTGHNAMVTQPVELAQLLNDMVAV